MLLSLCDVRTLCILMLMIVIDDVIIYLSLLRCILPIHITFLTCISSSLFILVLAVLLLTVHIVLFLSTFSTTEIAEDVMGSLFFVLILNLLVIKLWGNFWISYLVSLHLPWIHLLLLGHVHILVLPRPHLWMRIIN